MTQTDVDRRIVELQQQRKQLLQAADRLTTMLIADAHAASTEAGLERADCGQMLSTVQELKGKQSELHAVKESLRAIRAGM